jgi:hypothetical protein
MAENLCKDVLYHLILAPYSSADCPSHCVQATAGLRLLSEAVAEELLDEVGKRIVPYLHILTSSNNQGSLGRVTHRSIQLYTKTCDTSF